MDDRTLQEIFADVGRNYGYIEVHACFTAYRDFKVKWVRSYCRADFQVSDYLEYAPVEAIRDCAKALFDRIVHQNIPAEGEPIYPEAMTSYILSDEFRERCQPMYIRRSRNVTRSTEGRYKDLGESLKRLKELGLVGKDEDPYITWTKEELSSQTGYVSTLMDTMVINCAFDDETIPDYVIDYVVYHHLVIIKDGAAKFNGDVIDMRAEEKKYPQWNEAEEYIQHMGYIIC